MSHEPERHQTRAENELWTSGEVATFLRISRRKLFYLRSQGMLPPTIRIGRSLRFRAAEVRAWVNAGCPSLAEWEVVKDRKSLEF